MSALFASKKEIISQAIKRLENHISGLQTEQKKKLTDANVDDIDKGDVAESPKEQMMDEVMEQGLSLEHLNQALEKLQRISSLATEVPAVSFGALLKTNLGYFLVGTAFPSFLWNGNKVIGLSTEAPLFKKLEGLKSNSKFSLKNIEYVIEEIV